MSDFLEIKDSKYKLSFINTKTSAGRGKASYDSEPCGDLGGGQTHWWAGETKRKYSSWQSNKCCRCQTSAVRALGSHRA